MTFRPKTRLFQVIPFNKTKILKKNTLPKEIYGLFNGWLTKRNRCRDQLQVILQF